MGGCAAGSLLGDIQNPIAGLMIGILATVLLQSSSTTTSIVVGLVPDAIDVKLGIFVIMGANIGTSVTSTIVAIGQMGDADQLERAFAGATVHDMFNFLAVGVLLPLEIVTGFLYEFTKVLLPDTVDDGDKWEGPLKKIVSPVVKLILIANKDVTKKVALGTKTCDDFYPNDGRLGDCTDSIESYDNCKSHVGLINCDKKSGNCPAFYVQDASQSDDEATGLVCFILAIVILCTCLIGLVKTLQGLLAGAPAGVIRKATDLNGVVAIIIGALMTILVQSSSITTSTLTPLVGLGVIQLEQMYPLTLGANIGTTCTALLASLVSDSVLSLQVALAHLFFNIFGILFWYGIPILRPIPLRMARFLGSCTRRYRFFPFIYIGVVFILLPVILFGISSLFERGVLAFTVLGVIVVMIVTSASAWLFYFLKYQGGVERLEAYMAHRGELDKTYNALPQTLEALREDIANLKAAGKV
jgi:sodium-dependent phosphate cotransporter